jgi:hypothetical protein
MIATSMAVATLTVVFTLTLLYFLEEPEDVSQEPFAFMLAAEKSVPFALDDVRKPLFDCVNPTERERVRQLVFDGVDRGLVEAMARLFEVWQRDPDQQQPKRAQVGTVNAVNAHNRARKLAFAWNPPEC